MQQRANPLTEAVSVPANGASRSELETASSPAETIQDCVAKLRLAQRTLGMEHDRAPGVELAHEERVVSLCFKTALAYLSIR